MMNNITLCYSSHRPETLSPTARVMQDHEVIILEEPLHADFAEVLSGNIAIGAHLLLLDVGYPEFAYGQWRMLQLFSRAGKEILGRALSRAFAADPVSSGRRPSSGGK